VIDAPGRARLQEVPDDLVAEVIARSCAAP